MPSDPSQPRARLDRVLVERGLFESRARAQAAITQGCVMVDGIAVKDPAKRIAASARLDARAPHPFVSRGGVKLAAALDHFGIDPSGLACLDIGASTGGFTDALLQRGARRVVAVDVGHGQLHPKLRTDPRVTALESTDARALTAGDLGVPPALIVADASFIALSKVLGTALDLAAGDARLVALVKPQFEVGPGHVARGGIVKDAARRRAALNDVSAWLTTRGWRVRGDMVSPILGGDGNEEFLLAAGRS